MATQLITSQRTVTAAEIQSSFPAVVERLRQRREHTMIQSSGVRVAVLLPVAEYEQLLRCQRLVAFDRFSRAVGREVERRGLSEEELMSELEAIRHRKWDELPEQGTRPDG